ncbi:ATP synthase subunit I [Arenimonas donghaensis]|uniref:ATP synthase subunit I n=1 Tax=Arenimonas donghaensis TaxID=375061 RepID=UPI0009FE84E2
MSPRDGGCYTFAASGNATESYLNRASPPVSPHAHRLPVLQLALGCAAAAIAGAWVGREAALAWLAGAAVIAAAQWVFSWRTELRSRSAPAARMFTRLLLGTVLKWLVVGAGLALAMTNGLPPAHVLGGALLAALAQIFTLPWLLR